MYIQYFSFFLSIITYLFIAKSNRFTHLSGFVVQTLKTTKDIRNSENHLSPCVFTIVDFSIGHWNWLVQLKYFTNDAYRSRWKCKTAKPNLDSFYFSAAHLMRNDIQYVVYWQNKQPLATSRNWMHTKNQTLSLNCMRWNSLRENWMDSTHNIFSNKTMSFLNEVDTFLKSFSWI